MKSLLVLFAVGALGAGPLNAVETQIQGGRVELINKGEEILFEDGVRLDRGNDVLKANRMRTTGSRDRVTATGNVSLLRKLSSTETWKGFGDAGYYETRNGSGFLSGGRGKRARLVQTTLVPPRGKDSPKPPKGGLFERNVDIQAYRFDIRNEGGSAQASGDVYGRSVDPETQEIFEFWSETANYNESDRTIVLSGGSQPMLRQTTGKDFRIMKGDVITYHIDTRKMRSEGNAQAVFTDLAGRSARK